MTAVVYQLQGRFAPLRPSEVLQFNVSIFGVLAKWVEKFGETAPYGVRLCRTGRDE